MATNGSSTGNGAGYDVLIIGAGPGGYVTAIRAAQLGLKTAVVENKHLGGICLNWGCIPTKALLRSAEVYDTFKHASDFGLKADGLGFDIDKVVSRSRAVSKRLNGGVGYLLKKNKVDVIWGRAEITAPGTVTVSEAPEAPKGALGPGTYGAKHIIIATGTRPRVLPSMEPDGERIWTYFEAMVPKTMPESVLVVGSGAIGIEFASFFSSMGAKVTVVELLDEILPVEDAEVAAHVRQRFQKAGIEILTGAKVTGVEKGDKLTATIETGGGRAARPRRAPSTG